MLRRYFHKVGPPAEGGRAPDNDKKEGHKAEEFPEVHDCFMIYDGQVANASARHRKQERRQVCSVKVAAPVYLDWSDKPITFDQGDHSDRVPSLGKYPLIVDTVIGNVRLTKVLMDGGSNLNIIYAETLGLLQIDLSTIRAGAAPFHGIMYCYITMSFGLRNAGATYQRCINHVFGEHIGRTVEAYVDAIVVKTRKASDLETTFKCLKAKGVKLNPEKCVFGVPRGMLLGFIVSDQGTEANPEKIAAIANMGPIKDLKGVQRIMGCLAALVASSRASAKEAYLCTAS
jgi:hypothetical protein